MDLVIMMDLPLKSSRVSQANLIWPLSSWNIAHWVNKKTGRKQFCTEMPFSNHIRALG